MFAFYRGDPLADAHSTVWSSAAGFDETSQIKEWTVENVSRDSQSVGQMLCLGSWARSRPLEARPLAPNASGARDGGRI